MRHRSAFIFFTALGLVSCLDDAELDTADSEQAIASNEGKWDVAIDAPWRIEPRTQLTPPPPGPGNECFTGNCVVRYPEIPIQLTVHDADMFADIVPRDPNTANQGGGDYAVLALGDFVDVTVTERADGVTNTTSFGITQLREIERQMNAWPNPFRPESVGFQPDHGVCKTWENPFCAPSFRNIGDTNEWHATLMYRPRTQRPNADVELDVTMRISRRDSAGSGHYRVIEHLRVHLAAASLPRFGADWAYGDLHYHSQGTDNEGESAYAYRGVLQAMAAMGLDFVLAADHASNAAQMTDMDQGDIEEWTWVDTSFNALRDMSPARYSHLHDWINSPGGANHQVLQVERWQDWGLPAIPQIILGGEIDAIPELTAAELPLGLRYGNGQLYKWFNACHELPDLVLQLGINDCRDFASWSPLGWSWNMAGVRAALVEQREPGRFLLKDAQGRGHEFFARQHLLYLPRVSDENGFVSSSTSKWGGAKRRLSEILWQDFEQRGVGYTFLAHPVAHASGSGDGRLGPDIVPYSDAQLLTAFASRHVLGLQLWNEDSKLQTKMSAGGAHAIDWVKARLDGTMELDWWPGSTWSWAEQTSSAGSLQHGAATWDKMLLWGLDPARTTGLSWLPAGQPRRVFMAGGSDAHGDFNVRREGEVTGTSTVTDTAIGKPRNLVFVGLPNGSDVAGDGSRPRSWSHGQLVSGLASGQFSITDGPAARIAIDLNRNGVIDAGDVPMGSTTQLAKGARVPLVVEFMSTPEFGHATGIDLYVGVHSDTLGKGMIYAPFDHGVHGREVTDTDGDGNADPQANWVSSHMHSPTGREFHRTGDHYWGDVTLRLGVADHPYGSIVRRTIEIDPARFAVLSFDCNEAVDRMETPDRFYVRAFVRTSGRDPANGACNPLREECIERWAFTNPVWVTTPSPPFTLTATAPTATLPPPPPFEAPNGIEAVRVDRREGRIFDRGVNSRCNSGVPPAPANEWWRAWPAIDSLRTALGWNGYGPSQIFGPLAGNGAAQHFSAINASIYFNPFVWPDPNASWGCAYVTVHGIRAAWWQSGSESGALGYPITDERYHGGGAYQYFDKGAIFWKSNLGTVILGRELAVKHLALMRAGNPSFPTASSVINTQPVSGVSATLENGAQIFAKNNGSPAFLVDGAILARYQQLGGPTSFLGYPVADAQVNAAGTRFQRFENGTLFSGAEMDLGVCTQSGAIRWPAALPDRPGE